MAGELLQKIQKLEKIIIEKNNKEFGKAAVEIINPSKVDEAVLGVPSGEEHVEGEHAEKEIEIEYLSIEASLRKSISEEEDAIASYIKRAKEALKHDQHPLYELYKELAGDEIVHAASLRAALDMFGMSDKLREIQGRLEAQSVMGKQISEAKEGEEDEHTKKSRQLREKADKAKKDFDFVAEYTRDKAAHARELVVGAINDLIMGKEDIAGTVEKIIKDGKAVTKTEKQHKGSSKKVDKKDKDE